MFRLRNSISMTLVVAGVVAFAACTSNTGEDDSSSTSSAMRNDGKEPNGTNPGKLSCEDHGFPGIDTAVDLGGVNRTLDLGGGASVQVTGAHAGKSWHFHYKATGASISLILMRSGNKDSSLALDPAQVEGDVERQDVDGESKPGLNRIAFCYKPGGNASSSSGGSSGWGGSSSGGSSGWGGSSSGGSSGWGGSSSGGSSGYGGSSSGGPPPCDKDRHDCHGGKAW